MVQVNTMRILSVILIVFALGGLAVSLPGCGSESDQGDLAENQVVTIQRGNLTIDITAVGNLALSRTEDLAFDIFYQEATVEEVLVEEGDMVEEGQLLAKLDASEWENELSTLENGVTTAERQLTSTERQLTSKEQDLIQAEINLRNAEIALGEARDLYTWPVINVARDNLADAEAFLQYVLDRGLSSETLLYAQSRVDAAESTLDAMVNSYDTEQVAVKKLQLELTQGKLEGAANAVEDAQTAIEDARETLADAQEELDEAMSKSPLVTATFTGFITKVNVEGGDEVLNGTVAVQLADPDKFEADVMISEMDITRVKLGGEARVQVDALSGLSLPAQITHIAPTATIQSGVVNYEVKVEIQSFQAVMQERQEARQEATQDISDGELPERLKQAIEEGRITREQAEEMMKQRQQGQGGQQGVPTAMHEDVQLREGLTVTVNILVDERKDVLLVPNKAITRKGIETYVQVLKDGDSTERLIQTGISDWQYTEVTEGLSEGEKVVVLQGTTSTSATQQPRGGIVPGMGRMLR